MRHQELELQVDAWLDGELAAVDVGDLEAHLEQCRDCARYRDERLELRHAIRTVLPPLTPSDALRARVRQGLAGAARAERARHSLTRRQWLGLAASLVIVALGGWQLGRLKSARGEDLGEEILRSHVRSLMPGHLTDVLSSDQHTVKPWFNSTLDYSPPVYDFAGRGYPLVGGRLEYIGGRKVAALVYARRKHLISVVVWPRSEGRVGGETTFRQGFNVLHVETPAYIYWVTSDLGRTELVEFAGLLRDAEALATPRD